MAEATDMELLQVYRREGSDEAFAELVRRHINLVYSAALRRVGNPAHAEEITHVVFIVLARKISTLRPDTVLAAWLHETTRLTALSFLRGERRRQQREQEAYMQSSQSETAGGPTWDQLAPLLDDAVAHLRKKDREAVLLRFFKDKSLAEIAATLQITEAAAQSRVHRAVEKLHAFFARRGIHSTATAITGAISTNSILPAPAALTKATITVALAKGATTSVSTTTLIQGALKLMAWTKIKTAAGIGAIALLVGGTTTVLATKAFTPAPKIISPVMVASNYPGDWIWKGDSQNLARVPPLLIIRPSQLPPGWVPFDMYGNNRYLAEGKTVNQLLTAVYSQIDSQWKLDFQVQLPTDKWDCIDTLQDTNWWHSLQSELNTRFHITEEFSTAPGPDQIVIVKAAP